MASDVKPPKGYRQMPSGRADAFFQPREGAVVHGEVLGRQIIKGAEGKERPVYQVKLIEDCQSCKIPVEKDWVDGVAKVGQIVAVDERAALTGLADAIGQVVYIQCGAEQSLSGGRSFWPFDVFIKE